MADFSAFVPFRIHRSCMYGSFAVVTKSSELYLSTASRIMPKEEGEKR